jgi:hypothetical protein
MPFELTWEARGVYKRFTGKVSFEDYSRSQELVLGDIRTDHLRYVINDLLSVEGYSVTKDQLEYLAAFNKGASLSNPRIRIAYVTRDLRVIAMLKLAAVLSSFELRHFPTLEDARAWIASFCQD